MRGHKNIKDIGLNDDDNNKVDDNNKDNNDEKGISVLGLDRDLGFSIGHKGHQGHQGINVDYDDNIGEDNEEENDKDDNSNKMDNNDKDISTLGLEENDNKCYAD